MCVVERRTVWIKMDKTTSDELRRALENVFGFKSFRSSMQQRAVETVAAGGQDVYISMPTGAGKSLCYQLPALTTARRGVTVVISPLIALMVNQLQQANQIGVCAQTINSTISQSERDQVILDLTSQKPKTQLLYITPEQAAAKGFRSILQRMTNNGQLARIAVDEAHCVSEWGHDFRPDYIKLGELRKLYPDVPWVALTATASLKVVDDIFAHLHLMQPVAIFQASSFRPNLFYDVVFKECLTEPYEHLKSFAVEALGDGWELEAPQNRGCGIVYCRTREACEDVAGRLTKLGFRSKPYHGGLKVDLRNKTQNEWMKGSLPVIVATVSFGMGIDKATVRFVVHWSVAQSVAGYYQESGRAGRDGKPSSCRIYYSRRDRDSIRYLLKRDEQGAKRKGEKIKAAASVKSFETMVKYCEGSACRHSTLVKEFGDEIDSCRQCDVCSRPKVVERQLAAFQNVQIARALGTKVRGPEGSDFFSDLYGGGRRGQQRENEEYGGYSDDDDSREKKAAKILSDLIRDELKRRREIKQKNSPKKNSLSGCGSTNVLQPNSNFIPEVNLKTRESFLRKLEQEMQKHYNSCQTHRVLTVQDIKNCAAEKELAIIKSKNNIHMYRKDFAEIIKSLREATRRLEIHTILSSYDQFRITGIQDSEASPGKQNDETTAADDGNAKKGNDEKTAESRASETLSSSKPDPTDKWEAAKRNLLSCPAIPIDWQREMDLDFRGSSCGEKLDKEEKVENLLKSRPMIRYFFESLESASQPTTSANDVPKQIPTTPIMVGKKDKKPFSSGRDMQQRSAEKHDLTSSSSSSSGQHRSKRSRNSSFDTNLKVAADMIRKFLDPMYREKRVTKDIFKLACRKLSYKLVNEETISSRAAEKAVKQLFLKRKFLKSEKDLADL